MHTFPILCVFDQFFVVFFSTREEGKMLKIYFKDANYHCSYKYSTHAHPTVRLCGYALCLVRTSNVLYGFERFPDQGCTQRTNSECSAARRTVDNNHTIIPTEACECPYLAQKDRLSSAAQTIIHTHDVLQCVGKCFCWFDPVIPTS